MTTEDCRADPCERHGVCHCSCSCGLETDDCYDCAETFAAGTVPPLPIPEEVSR